MGLQRESARPMYVQLKEAIVADIARGHYQPHQRLSSERDLCERYGVSRMTVRQALVELVREGVIYTRIGKGTFVSPPRPAPAAPGAAWSFSQEVRARGGTPASRVLDAAVLLAPAPVALALQIARQAEVIMLVRVRLANGTPLALETAFLPFLAFPDLLRHDFGSESLHHVLERGYGLALAQAEQPLEAALADAREAEVLGLPWPAAVLKQQRLLLREGQAPVAFVRTTCRGDYYARLAALGAP